MKYNKNKRTRFIIQGFISLFLLIAVVLGAANLDTIREFFTQASAEPANLIVDTQGVLGPMPRPWQNLAQGGEAHDWRLQPLTNQVAALNPEYIRIDHIYDFYDIVQGSPGNLTFNFDKLDLMLNDILATGAKPYIALSYMPPAISAGDIVDQPVNYTDWQVTVQRTIQHVSGTRGISDVYYEVWNEPDLFGGWKYYGNKNYLNLYTHAARGAANTRGVRPFKLGGPATTALYRNWFQALAKHAVRNNLRLDFLSWHRYDYDLDQYKKDISQARTWLQTYPELVETTELHLTEWGHDSEIHRGYDTNFSSAHTVAGAIEMVGVLDRAFAFEIQDGKDPEGNEFWGRWGLFTHNDFGAKAKPRYYALRMLDSIADQRLQILGKGTWVKALAAKIVDDSYQVLLANYDAKGRNTENVPITFENISPGTYTITKKYLGGQRQVERVATTSATLRTFMFMPVNSVGMVEIAKEKTL